MISPKAEAILQERGIDLEIAARFGIASIKPAGGHEAIEIPYLRGGAVVNHKRRTIDGPKKFWQDANAPKVFYNVDVLADESLVNEPLVITEGEFDALITIQCGFAKTISVPDGAPAERIADPESRKYTFIEAAGNLAGHREIVLATDGDRQGRNLMVDLAVRLGKARCKWFEYPAECKDLNEVFLRHGADAVRKLIRTAQWFQLENTGRLKNFAPTPDPLPYSTGMPWLDEHFKLRLGDFSVITGIPGMGKTTWVDDWSCRVAEQWGWCVARASFEHEPRPHQEATLRQWKLRKPVSEASREEIATVDDWIERSFAFVVPIEDRQDPNRAFDLDWLLECFAAAVIRYGAKLCIIDPWNEIEHAKPRDMSMTEYVGNSIREMKRFARKYNVHLSCVTHPTKLKADNHGKLPVPTLYDIADSAHFANKPDAGIVIHRDYKSGLTLCRVAKSRDHDRIGKPGDSWMSFNPYKRRFEAAPTPSELSA